MLLCPSIENKIEELIEQYPEWRYENNRLIGQWKMENFAKVKSIISQLCELAEELRHHPTVTFAYNTLNIESTAHDAGNTVTDLDIELARRVSELVGS